MASVLSRIFIFLPYIVGALREAPLRRIFLFSENNRARFHRRKVVSKCALALVKL